MSATSNAVDVFAKAQRRSLIMSLLAFGVIGLTLAYSAWKLNSLREEVSGLQETKAGLDRDIAVKQRSLTDLNKQLESTRSRFAQVQQLLVDTSGSNPQTAMQRIETSIGPNTAELLPRVYIHISAEAQRDSARRAASALQEQAYLAPGIQNVGRKAPPHTELRYFSAGELPEAQKILAVVKRAGVDADLSLLGHLGSRVRPHHFELWFGSE